MKVLAVLAQKGGSGKTTITVHMAICAVRNNLRTAIIDIDPQASAFKWNESRPEDERLDAIKADAAQIAPLLKQAEAGGIDLVIIDTAPHSDSAAAIVARYADFVLIPCRPARFDLDTINFTAEIARLAKARAAVVINAAPRGKLAQEAQAAIKAQGIEIIPTVLQQRAAYSHAVIDGRSVHEYEPNGKAAAEIESLYNHIARSYIYIDKDKANDNKTRKAR